MAAQLAHETSEKELRATATRYLPLRAMAAKSPDSSSGNRATDLLGSERFGGTNGLASDKRPAAEPESPANTEGQGKLPKTSQNVVVKESARLGSLAGATIGSFNGVNLAGDCVSSLSISINVTCERSHEAVTPQHESSNDVGNVAAE